MAIHTNRSSSPPLPSTDTARLGDCIATVGIIALVATIALGIAAFAYQIRVLTGGHAAGPMLPITMTAACLSGLMILPFALCSKNKKIKLLAVIMVAATITTIALAACCYRGVFSAKIFAKAALITSGTSAGLSMLLQLCTKD